MNDFPFDWDFKLDISIWFDRLFHVSILIMLFACKYIIRSFQNEQKQNKIQREILETPWFFTKTANDVLEIQKKNEETI